MGRAPDWLAEEERLERLAKTGALAGSGTTGFQRKNHRKAAFEYAAVLMVIIFLGLLCWNWNTWTPADDWSDRIEYNNAFYRALEEGPPPQSSSILRRTGYRLGMMPEARPPKTPLDRLLLPEGGSSLQAWLEGKDAGKLRLDNSLKWISLSPREPGSSQKKAWLPVRDLLGEVPRGID